MFDRRGHFQHKSQKQNPDILQQNKIEAINNTRIKQRENLGNVTYREIYQKSIIPLYMDGVLLSDESQTKTKDKQIC